MVLIAVLVVISAVWLWRRSRNMPPDADSRIRNLRASTDARTRLDEHRNPSQGSAGSGSGGVGGVIG
ncbi:hypothetical protein [Micromonospora sp. CA-111912]|uniref:hypothetical protein n=1 Tax=Micromonospora sp. CA-111912 TaxID=3239955 RepID=UPI003D8D816C